MNKLLKLYFKIFNPWIILETKFVTWDEGNTMIRDTQDKPDSSRWVLAKEEDYNRIIGMVYLCRKVRING